MRVLLVGPDHEENLSIRYLSSSLIEARHETRLAAFNCAADIHNVAEAAKDADVVGLSMCFQSRADEFLRLARLIKSHAPEKLVVAGGHYVSCAAEPLLANHAELDVIAIHESEQTLVEIASPGARWREELPNIRGIAYRDGGQVRFTEARRTIDDLDTLPFPDRRGPVHTIAGVTTSYLMGSRGCYGNCAYCCITTLHRMAPGKRFRQRDPERIAEEMAWLYRERGTRQFVFHDDNFLVPADKLNAARISVWRRALQQRGVKDIALVIKCRPADASRDVLRRLKDMGLVRVFMGIESSTERGLATLERDQTMDESVRALELCAELDISAQFTMMIFNPAATLETLRSDVAFMRRFISNPLNFCRTEIYTGTPLERRMIALGRARGDYRAREYNLLNPVADRACNLSLDLFHARCWGHHSLMQNSIGLDHVGAVVKRFHHDRKAETLCNGIGGWLRSVNMNTLDLLEEVINLSASGGRAEGPEFKEAVQSIREREEGMRQILFEQGMRLRERAESLPFEGNQRSGSRLRLAKQAAAAVLAVGMPASAGIAQAMAQTRAQVTESAKAGEQKSTGSLAGTVTDPTGAVIANATITITNPGTGAVRTLKTNSVGNYEVTGLAVGRYNVKVQMPGFKAIEKAGVEVKAAAQERFDFKMELAFTEACCEYAAAPLKVEPQNYAAKKKPFTYMVGSDADQGTFKGVAKLVYGDENLWVEIFEANRNIVQTPEPIPYGTSLTIPKVKRMSPKLISKIMPEYPGLVRSDQVWGDVVIDVTLTDDGSVEKAEVIDAKALLTDSAVNAVKQWKFEPPKTAEAHHFVVVISFGKHRSVKAIIG